MLPAHTPGQTFLRAWATGRSMATSPLLLPLVSWWALDLRLQWAQGSLSLVAWVGVDLLLALAECEE